MNFQPTLSFAKKLDASSGASFRDAFYIPQHRGKDAIYFLGNSLGLQPKQTSSAIHKVMLQWLQHGVEGFFTGKNPWLHYHDQLVKPLSKIVGAKGEETVVMNSLTVNLHLMLVSFYQPRGRRNKILMEAKAFPSDQYTIETHLRPRGLDPAEAIIEIAPRQGELLIDEEDILAAIEANKETLALVFLGGVNYYTGQVFNMQKITEAAHEAGAKAGFDLAHAAGNIELQLHDWDVDFACWCSYKYLNSGPGAIGGAFVHERFHGDKNLSRFGGWWGYKKETRFQMRPYFDPASTAEGWQLSTPSPLLYAAHKAALDLFDKTNMKALQEKGQQLSSFLIFLLNDWNASLTQPFIKVLTPPAAKGCQVSMLMRSNGKQIFDDLAKAGVYADWREPDVMRVAPVPLYNSFEEVWHFVQLLKQSCTGFI